MTTQEEARRKAEQYAETISSYPAVQEGLIQAFIAGYTADKWIDCKVRLPDTGRNVIGFTNTGRCRWTFRNGKEYAFDEMELREDISEFYTHWCELPEPPKTNEG